MLFEYSFQSDIHLLKYSPKKERAELISRLNIQKIYEIFYFQTHNIDLLNLLYKLPWQGPTKNIEIVLFINDFFNIHQLSL